MGDAGKHSQGAIMASDLKTLFPAIGSRRTKVFTYGFVMAFVACTVFLAFSPSGNASPWFNNLFTSSSSISTSFQPYRSQFSSFVSYLFPNSSAPQTPIPPQKPLNLSDSRSGSPGNLFPVADRKGKGVGFRKDGSFRGNGSSGNGVPAKNQTGTGSEKNGADDKKDGVLAGEKLNQTVSGSGLPGTGVSEKNQTLKPVDARENGDSAKNSSGGNGSKIIPVLVGKNQTVSGHGIGVSVKDQAGGNVNVNVTGSGLQGSGVPMAAKEQTGHEVSANIQKGSNAGGVLAENPKKSETPAADHKGDTTGGKVSNFTAKKPSDAIASKGVDQKKKELIENMVGCDLFHGHWVRDESYPLYSEGSCPHIDEPFDCYHNGRPDRTYQQLRWQPSGCNIPRLNATDMLERLRGKRLVFVGDSLNRNMWESLVCVLRNAVKDKKKVFEMSGKHEFKTEGSYSFLFKDYGCTVEFFRSPFLVQEWEMPGNNGTKKETLRLDLVEKSASKYKDAHVIIFNTGHWWTHEKTSKGKDYYQEGNKIYDELDVADAFHKALHTWAKWIDANVNPKKSLVFFRGYSASHFRGGQWNSGGQCDRETEPIKNEAYLSSYPPKMSILETVIKEMKTHVSYLNITRMTDYRKDAHPSIYREPNMTDEERRAPDNYQDCSHWCLPGVPDTWNELLYATLLIKQHEMLH